MFKRKIVLAGCALFSMAATSSAALVWSESFPDADGTAVDRVLTTGTGNLDVTGTVTYASGAIVITPDGGSDRIELESTAAALAGNFTFDASRTGTGNGSLFVQLVDGDGRSSGTNGVPDFADTLNLAAITTPTVTVQVSPAVASSVPIL